MHPMMIVRNKNSHRNRAVVKPSGGFLRRLGLAYVDWQRHRAILALKMVNPRWLKYAGIDHNDIEALVNRVVEREIPVPATALPAFRDQNSWRPAA